MGIGGEKILMVTYINIHESGVWITMNKNVVQRQASMKMSINFRFKLKQGISWTAECQLLEEKRIVKLDQSVTATCTARLECNYWEEPPQISLIFKMIQATYYKRPPFFWDVTQSWLIAS